ncbi:hypothetical protein [Microbacterium sp. NPDC089695]|uniref:hypothetical protein n=1 Tax=Microbacterium sp. NPDC089695 TaxID=3364198 RepID=UPI00380CF0E8
MTRTLKTLLALVAVGAGVVFTPVSAALADVHPAASAESVQWSVAPAAADGADGRISLRHTIEPGAVVADAIVVANTGAVDATFEVRAGDGVVGGDGAFDIAQGAPAGSGAWIAIEGLAEGQVALAAGESRILPITISVPADAVPGDHPAGIVVGIAQQNDGVTVHHRIGVRAHLQVAGDIAPALEVSDVQTSYEGSWNPFDAGVLTVEYTVANTGNVRFGASGGVAVSGPFGLGAAGAQSDEAMEMLPGATTTRVHEVAISPLLLLMGDVTVTPLVLGDDAFAAPDAVSSGFTVVAVPWGAVIGLMVLAGVVLLVIRVIRRGRRRTEARIQAAVAEARASVAREREGVLS